jgi:hypothetical protein
MNWNGMEWILNFRGVKMDKLYPGMQAKEFGALG